MLRIVEVTGSGAGEFLARVTAGTVKPLTPGQGAAGILLNGQSRVLAQFDLLRVAPNHFRLAAPDACAASLAESLEALHFSEDLEIKLTDVRAAAVAAGSGARERVFAHRGDGWPSPVPGYDFSTEASGVPAGWEAARIAALVPWPVSEWTSGETPALEAGMLPWIDRDKGCYPGQEVVERSLNVGHPARVLVAVEGDGPWEGAAVTSSVRENGKWRAIVRLLWSQREKLPPGISRIASHW